MKIFFLICRIVLGLGFLFFGFLGVHPPANMKMPPMPPDAVEWSRIMIVHGYQFAIAVFQMLGGLLVLIGGTAPLGLCILCPITVNILLYHFCLMGGQGVAPGLLTAMLELVVIAAYRSSFAGILTAKAKMSGPRV